MSDTKILYESEARGTSRPARSSPREAAPRIAAPPTDGPRLQRRRRTTNVLYVDPRIIPPGMSYEWKRESIFGQKDPEHQIALRENHWTPVPASRHPELAMGDDNVIRRGGTILMQRPSYLTDEAQFEEIQEALRPVNQKNELLYGTPSGTMTRDHPSVRKIAGINQQWSPGDPIEDGRLVSEP